MNLTIEQIEILSSALRGYQRYLNAELRACQTPAQRQRGYLLKGEIADVKALRSTIKDMFLKETSPTTKPKKEEIPF